MHRDLFVGHPVLDLMLHSLDEWLFSDVPVKKASSVSCLFPRYFFSWDIVMRQEYSYMQSIISPPILKKNPKRVNSFSWYFLRGAPRNHLIQIFYLSLISRSGKNEYSKLFLTALSFEGIIYQFSIFDLWYI